MRVLFFFLLAMTEVSGQTLSGRVTQASGAPLPFAHLRLWRADSSLAAGAVADTGGYFVLRPSVSSAYRLTADAVGYASGHTNFFRLSRDTTVHFLLAPQTADLGEVTVKASRPAYEQQMDKLVVHVASLLTASGGNALDVLERAPGVTVNRQQQAVSLAGRPGTTILIDGKRYPAETVMALLSGLPAGQIEKIELMTAPSARYDAEGGGGIIQLILRKNALNGFNGSWQASAGTGRFEKLNGYLRLAWRRGKWSLQTDFSLTQDREWQRLELYSRAVRDTLMVTNHTRKESFNVRPFQQMRLSADYAADSRTTVGVTLSGFHNGFRSTAPARQETTQNGRPAESVTLRDAERNQWLYGMASGYITRRLMSRATWSADVDYARYANHNPHDYVSEQGIANQVFRTRKETPIRLWVVKSDYTVNLPDGSRFDTGIKGTWTGLTNDVRVETLSDPGWQTDTSMTRYYSLRERILAGYATFLRPVSAAIRLQLGIRYEHTDFVIPEAGIDRRYGNWFPGVHISHDWSHDRSVQLSYTRRIQRPGYDLLAPWVMFLNPYTFITGNTRLLPGFSDVFQATYRFRGSYLLTAGYIRDRDALDRFRFTTDPLTNRSYITPQNVRLRHTFSVQASVPVRITRWWSAQQQATGSFVRQETPVDGQPVRQQQWSLTLYTGHTFVLSRSLTAEVTANYQSPVLSGTTRMRGQGAVNLGIRKKWANSSLTGSVSDLFRTTTLRADNVAITDASRWAQYYEPRVCRLTWAHAFGKSLLPAAAIRRSGSEDERNRVSSH